MNNQKEIMTYYIAESKDNYFVHGSPPIETIEVVDYDIYQKIFQSLDYLDSEDA
ncbi:hypothetical protein [Vibrio sp.]|uniref:hypothetical protein n=1 Tax=Vibrio sp. TaxID=678 RepID=UPI003AA9719C